MELVWSGFQPGKNVSCSQGPPRGGGEGAAGVGARSMEGIMCILGSAFGPLGRLRHADESFGVLIWSALCAVHVRQKRVNVANFLQE